MRCNEKKTSFPAKEFFLSLLLCFGGGWITGLLTQHGIKDWYPELVKSSATPKNFVFPIAWSILYFFMAISLTLLWISDSLNKKWAYLFFGVQLALNFSWSWIFFYLQEPGFALIDILVLLVFILITIVAVWRHSRYASGLLVPYLLWVAFASYLNLFIWLNN